VMFFTNPYYCLGEAAFHPITITIIRVPHMEPEEPLSAFASTPPT